MQGPLGGAGLLKLRLPPPREPASSHGRGRSGGVRSGARLEIFFQICGTCSKAFLISLSFNSGAENPVCKMVPPKSMLVASYKEGVGTEKMSVMPFILQSWASEGLEEGGDKVCRQSRAPHAAGVRGHGALCRASVGPRTNDCGSRVLSPWPPPATDWREQGHSQVA